MKILEISPDPENFSLLSMTSEGSIFRITLNSTFFEIINNNIEVIPYAVAGSVAGVILFVGIFLGIFYLRRKKLQLKKNISMEQIEPKNSTELGEIAYLPISNKNLNTENHTSFNELEPQGNISCTIVFYFLLVKINSKNS